MIRKNIPNMLTCANLFCGCLGLIACFRKEFELCAWLILIAALFDFADGAVARLLKSESHIGKDLDSLADMVTFGVLPGFILYQMLLFSIGNSSLQPDKYHPVWYTAYAGLLIPIFSAIRLAVFNHDTDQKTYFKGLPTPANTLLISWLPLLAREHVFFQNWLSNTFFLLLITVTLSFLLVSKIPIHSLKFKNLAFKENAERYIIILAAITGILIMGLASLPLVIVFYILLSFIKPPVKS